MAYAYIHATDLVINKIALDDDDKAKLAPHINSFHNEVIISSEDALGFLKNSKNITNITSTSVTFEDWDGNSVDGNQIELTEEHVKKIIKQDLSVLQTYLGSSSSDNHYFFPRIWEYVNYLKTVDTEAISYPINDWYKYLDSIGQSFIRPLQLP